jgi:DNA processing protein
MEVFDVPSHYYPSDAMSLDELAYWITFNRVSGIGPVSFKSLLEYYDNDLEAAWRSRSASASFSELQDRRGYPSAPAA